MPSPSVSLYRLTLPPVMGVSKKLHASAIPSIASTSCAMISGRSGLPKFRQSVTAIGSALDPGSRTGLAYQSKLGPVEWLGPQTIEVLGELGRKGEKQVLVVPIAFVTDHIETLYEIDQLFARAAAAAGIACFRRTPGLNAHPAFLEALASMIDAREELWR